MKEAGHHFTENIRDRLIDTIFSLRYQLVFESRLSGARESVVGLDDVFTKNGSCCSIRNTPEKTEKGNTFVDGIYMYIFDICTLDSNSQADKREGYG